MRRQPLLNLVSVAGAQRQGGDRSGHDSAYLNRYYMSIYLLDTTLEGTSAKQAVEDLLKQWSTLLKLQSLYQNYLDKDARENSADKKNQVQHTLRETFDPFFEALHKGLKSLDKTVRQHERKLAEQAKAEGKRLTTDRKTKTLKTALEALHQEVKTAENYYKHIQWLQERFPKAQYEDVIGLCKLATLTEVKEQDYSLNPGRYVGVVIEEDGKTEEEFVGELLGMNDELIRLNEDAHGLEGVIAHNVAQMAGDE
jgi:type I restriction enzyme M protein